MKKKNNNVAKFRGRYVLTFEIHDRGRDGLERPVLRTEGSPEIAVKYSKSRHFLGEWLWPPRPLRSPCTPHAAMTYCAVAAATVCRCRDLLSPCQRSCVSSNLPSSIMLDL